MEIVRNLYFSCVVTKENRSLLKNDSDSFTKIIHAQNKSSHAGTRTQDRELIRPTALPTELHD